MSPSVSLLVLPISSIFLSFSTSSFLHFCFIFLFYPLSFVLPVFPIPCLLCAILSLYPSSIQQLLSRFVRPSLAYIYPGFFMSPLLTFLISRSSFVSVLSIYSSFPCHHNFPRFSPPFTASILPRLCPLLSILIPCSFFVLILSSCLSLPLFHIIIFSFFSFFFKHPFLPAYVPFCPFSSLIPLLFLSSYLSSLFFRFSLSFLASILTRLCPHLSLFLFCVPPLLLLSCLSSLFFRLSSFFNIHFSRSYPLLSPSLRPFLWPLFSQSSSARLLPACPLPPRHQQQCRRLPAPSHTSPPS